MRHVCQTAAGAEMSVKDDILRTGLILLRAGVEPSARRIASELSLAGHAAVLYHFQTSRRLYDAVAAHAVQVGESRVIVKLIAAQHPAICDMPDAERVKHLQACR